jgi:hypothetical protein
MLAFNVSDLSGKRAECKVGSIAGCAGEDEWAVAHAPCGQGAEDGVSVDARCGPNHVSDGALTDHEKPPAVAPALKLALEPLPLSAKTSGQVTGGLALDHNALREAGKGNVSCFEDTGHNLPTLGQVDGPGVRVGFACVKGERHAIASIFPLRRIAGFASLHSWAAISTRPAMNSFAFALVRNFPRIR